MERVGGLMVFNVNNPAAPQFVQYINNRGLTGLTGDRGPEGIIYVKQQAKNFVITMLMHVVF